MLQPEVAPDDTTVPGVAAEPALAPTAKVDHVNAVGAVRVTDAPVTVAVAAALTTFGSNCAVTEIEPTVRDKLEIVQFPLLSAVVTDAAPPLFVSEMFAFTVAVPLTEVVVV
jgi:hypothetical protein